MRHGSLFIDSSRYCQTSPKTNNRLKWRIPEAIHIEKCIYSSALKMKSAYIQVHLRLEFFKEANNINPDQTALKGAV